MVVNSTAYSYPLLVTCFRHEVSEIKCARIRPHTKHISSLPATVEANPLAGKDNLGFSDKNQVI